MDPCTQVAMIGADSLGGCGAANDSLGSVHPADTMDTDLDEDPEAGGGIIPVRRRTNGAHRVGGYAIFVYISLILQYL